VVDATTSSAGRVASSDALRVLDEELLAIGEDRPGSTETIGGGSSLGA